MVHARIAKGGPPDVSLRGDENGHGVRSPRKQGGALRCANTGEVDPNELAGEIVEKALDSEPVRNCRPIDEEHWADSGANQRRRSLLHGTESLEHFHEVGSPRKGEPLDSRGFKRVLPLLRDAAMQSDDELQETVGQSLLENVANDTKGVLPSFGQTLSQITSAEARYLDRILWESVTAPKLYNSGKRQGRDELNYFNLLDIYDPKLRAPSPRRDVCLQRPACHLSSWQRSRK